MPPSDDSIRRTVAKIASKYRFEGVCGEGSRRATHENHLEHPLTTGNAFQFPGTDTMSDHDEQVTSSQWAYLDAGSDVARAQLQGAIGPAQADRLPPPDERETVPASLYDMHATSPRTIGVAKDTGPAKHSDLEGALGAAAFAALQPQDLVTTKDKILSATLALLSRHDAGRLSRDHFASETLYRNAVSASVAGKSHAMQILLAISRIEDVSPKHLILACEPPLGLDIVAGRYVMSVLGNAVHHHHVSTYVVRMLARALTTFWADNRLEPREQATKYLPLNTATLYF